MNIRIRISDEHLPAFLAYLGLGTLYAIRKGTVPVETGIWTLARPVVWDFLYTQPNMPRSLIKVYQTADELSAIKTLLPNELDTVIGELMDDLEKGLAKMEDQTWLIEWGVEPTPPPWSRSKTRKHKQIPFRKRMRNKRK